MALCAPAALGGVVVTVVAWATCRSGTRRPGSRPHVSSVRCPCRRRRPWRRVAHRAGPRDRGISPRSSCRDHVRSVMLARAAPAPGVLSARRSPGRGRVRGGSSPVAELVAQERLLRRDLAGAAFGGIIGSGWMLSPMFGARIAGPAVLVSWLVGGVAVALVGAVVELGTSRAEADGGVRWPLYASGRLVGTVAGGFAPYGSGVSPRGGRTPRRRDRRDRRDRRFHELPRSAPVRPERSGSAYPALRAARRPSHHVGRVLEG